MTHATPPTGSPAPPPAAALWDFDGTLVDTEPIWMRGQYALTDEFGVPWDDEHAANLVGNSLLTSGAYICRVLTEHLGTDHGQTPESVVGRLVDYVVQGIRELPELPWLPGAQQLLASFAEAGVPCALVSASYRPVLDAVLDRLPTGTFDAVVAGDDVRHGKPHPEPYLSAAATLGVDPTRCVVLEDSVPGSTSGNAAGAVVLAIRNHVTIPAAPRRVLLDTLSGLDAAGVSHLVATAGIAGSEAVAAGVGAQ